MSEFYRVQIAHEAKKMLRDIGKKYGRKNYEMLRDMIRELEFDPDKKGRPLSGKLHGLYSLHYSRFRVVYRIMNGHAEVIIVAAGFHASGERSDIYKAIERLVETGKIQLKP